MEYEVCLTLLHIASTGNQTPDLLILSPYLPYPLGHVLLIILLWGGGILDHYLKLGIFLYQEDMSRVGRYMGLHKTQKQLLKAIFHFQVYTSTCMFTKIASSFLWLLIYSIPGSCGEIYIVICDSAECAKGDIN